MQQRVDRALLFAPPKRNSRNQSQPHAVTASRPAHPLRWQASIRAALSFRSATEAAGPPESRVEHRQRPLHVSGRSRAASSDGSLHSWPSPPTARRATLRRRRPGPAGYPETSGLHFNPTRRIGCSDADRVIQSSQGAGKPAPRARSSPRNRSHGDLPVDSILG